MSNNYINDSQASEIVKYISDTMKFPIMGAGGGFAPIGTINPYMGTVAPIGWLVCDGTVYNISDYPDLATHIASQFGSVNFFGGDGTITFAVPDTTDITSTTLENGVYIIKATLSDAEVASYHVYTPREHQVAWWEEEIDGVLKRKPVYERTFSGGALSTGVTVIDTLDNVERITKSNHCIYNKLNQAFPEYSLSNNTFAVFLDRTSVKINIGTGWTGNDAITSYNVTFRYTKSTDQWQTS